MTLLGIIVGYALCIVLPCPFISSWVLRGWNDLGTWLRSKL